MSRFILDELYESNTNKRIVRETEKERLKKH